jgi:predicted methyltransferase
MEAEKSACEMISKVGIVLREDEVCYAYRTGRRGPAPRHIIVKITTQKRRDQIMRAKRDLKDKERAVYLNDDLTPMRAVALKLLKKNHLVHSKDGRLVVKKSIRPSDFCG